MANSDKSAFSKSEKARFFLAETRYLALFKWLANPYSTPSDYYAIFPIKSSAIFAYPIEKRLFHGCRTVLHHVFFFSLESAKVGDY